MGDWSAVTVVPPTQHRWRRSHNPLVLVRRRSAGRGPAAGRRRYHRAAL